MSTDDDNIEIIGAQDPQLMAAEAGSDDDKSITDLVEQPAKVMRIGTMIKQLLEEVKAAPLDEASRNRLPFLYKRSVSIVSPVCHLVVALTLHYIQYNCWRQGGGGRDACDRTAMFLNSFQLSH